MYQTKRGFTLVELLVVVFILGILIALILPAIHRSRQAARQVQCVSNLSQVGKGLLNFETQQQQLPALGVYDESLHGALRSWVVDLLPHLDASSLAWNNDEVYFDSVRSRNAAIASASLSVLRCPQDDTAAPEDPTFSYVVNAGYAREQTDPNENELRVVAWDVYPYVGDYTLTRIDLNGNSLILSLDTKSSKPHDIDILRQTGIFFYAYQSGSRPKGGSIPLAAVRDGLSQTILVSENLWARAQGWVLAPDGATWAQPDGTAFYLGGEFCGKKSLGVTSIVSCSAGNVNYENANNHGAFPSSDQAINGPGVGPKFPRGSPWLASNHAGGVNIFLCDGSARFLSENVNGTVLARLVSPDGTRLPPPLRQGPLDAKDF